MKLAKKMSGHEAIGHGLPRVAGYEGYAAVTLTHKHGITVEQARDLIARIGNSCHELDRAASKLKAMRP